MASTIVRASIHPAIGIARVGSSQHAFVLAPQVPHPAPRPAGSSHDDNGELKREAVEFRVYGYDANGNVVAELTAANADIVWTVHVANTKAAWFKFRNAMDIDSLRDTVVERRNPEITDPGERRTLIIDPGSRSIEGRNQGGEARHCFDTGTFKGLPVYLGELRTDNAGRLLFLGGRGVSRSPGGAPPFVDTDADPFGNAADWHDDIADGPVEASVHIGGRQIATQGGWIVSAPPNYAPDIKSWRTLFDLLSDLYVREKWLARKTEVSFTRDVYPILGRLTGLQWVNKSFSAIFGHKAPFDFADPVLTEKISQIHGGSGIDVFKPLRVAIFKLFREPTPHPSDPAAWPWLYGDAFGTPSETDPNLNLPLDGERLGDLRSWSEGKFVADWGMLPNPPTSIDLYPLNEQPAALDRAALDFCAADAFHPGIELTWPMRHLSLYTAPFRIKPATAPERDYGARLDVATALGAEGPLHAQFPGSLSRWMLLPWQIDTGGCLAGYDDRLVFDAPSFWPSRVPNYVLPYAHYANATDLSLSRTERVYAFAERRSWFFPLNSPATDWGRRLIDAFGSMGVVEAYPGLAGDADIPPMIYVETLPGSRVQPSASAGAPAEARALAGASPADQRARTAGFADEADRIAMRRMRFGR
jgi:hypothetical protein